MRRRDFAILLAAPWSADVFTCLSAAKEPPPLIGFLSPTAASSLTQELGAFRQGLEDYGYRDGQTIRIAYRWANERFDRLPQLAGELVALNVDVIVAVVTQAAVATSRATHKVPIVMIGVSDPVGAGLVESLSHPGGNVTGTSSIAEALSGKPIEMLQEMVPGLRRAAVLWNPSNEVFQRRILKQAENAAGRLDIELVPLAAEDAAGIDRAFKVMTEERVRAMYVLVDPTLISRQRQIIENATKAGILSVSGTRSYAANGGLLSYGPNYAALSRRAAFFVDRILKGSRPAELPVEQPTQFELVVNVKTAKALGLTVPSSLLARADEVIE